MWYTLWINGQIRTGRWTDDPGFLDRIEKYAAERKLDVVIERNTGGKV